MTKFKSKFKDMWYSSVRDQLIKCSPEYKNICEFDKLPEEEKLKESSRLIEKGFEDLEAQFYIGKLLLAGNHALCHDKPDLNFVACFIQVKDTLNDPSYWEIMFNNDFSSEEAQELKKLTEMLIEISKFL